MPAVSERDRHDLFVAVQDRFGERHADTLMNLLPPVGWADVATKDDIHHLGNRVTAEAQRLDGEIQHVRKEIVGLEDRISLRFDAVDVRFESVDRRFESVDRRIDTVERTMHERFDAADRTMNERFDAADRTMNDRFDHADAVWGERFATFGHKVEGDMHELKGEMHKAMERHLHALVFGFVASFTSMTSLGIAAIALA